MCRDQEVRVGESRIGAREEGRARKERPEGRTARCGAKLEASRTEAVRRRGESSSSSDGERGNQADVENEASDKRPGQQWKREKAEARGRGGALAALSGPLPSAPWRCRSTAPAACRATRGAPRQPRGTPAQGMGALRLGRAALETIYSHRSCSSCTIVSMELLKIDPCPNLRQGMGPGGQYTASSQWVCSDTGLGHTGR